MSKKNLWNEYIEYTKKQQEEGRIDEIAFHGNVCRVNRWKTPRGIVLTMCDTFEPEDALEEGEIVYLDGYTHFDGEIVISENSDLKIYETTAEIVADTLENGDVSNYFEAWKEMDRK